MTAAFNLNVLSVLRRELGADIDDDGFEHVAVWDADNAWIEMRLRARHAQSIRILDLEVAFADGEHLRTEISAKFTRDRVAAELTAAGMRLQRWWTDPGGDYALSVAVRQPG